MGRRLLSGEPTKLCPGGLHERALRTTVACMQCASIAALDELVATIATVLPAVADIEDAAEVVAAAAWTGAQRRSLTAHLRAHPDALISAAWAAPPSLARLTRRLISAGVDGVAVPQPPSALCPAGRHTRSGWLRPSSACTACAADLALDEAVVAVHAQVPSLPAEELGAIVAGAARNRLGRLDLIEHLRACPDALSSGSSDVPRTVLDLVDALIDAGADGVDALRCVACNKATPNLACVGDGGRLCQTCAEHRRDPEPCTSCGRLRPVAARTAERAAVCGTCLANDSTRWEPCSRCGTTAQVVTSVEGRPLGRCCYVTPLIRCTMCGTAKGARPWKTRRPVCPDCAATPTAPCSVCERPAPVAAPAGLTVCAVCHITPAEPCRACGRPTPGRDRGGRPRCFDCYQRPVRPCGRCGRVRAIARLATADEPELCAICWTGPTATCASCGDVRPCRGERRGRMLCPKCAPVTAQPCAHCGRLRKVTAQWVEGPVCGSCYGRALRAKGDCPRCRRWRRLRTYAGIDTPVCSDCAGAEPHSVCGECGAEDHLYERGRCPACALRHRLDRILGDRGQRERNGLGPVHDTLARLGSPRDVIRWLQLSDVAHLLRDMATGQLAVSFDALDRLPRSRAVWFVEHLLTTAGVLAGRDPVLARFELWVADWLDAIEVADIERILRRYATWEVLRRLRETSTRRWLSDHAHNSAKSRLQASLDLLTFLNERGRSLDGCRQDDLETWAGPRPKSRVRAAQPFWGWAVRRHLVPHGLTFPSAPDAPRGAVPAGDGHWDLARRLLHGEGIDPHDRVAGLLVVLYAQPVSRVARLTDADVTAAPGTFTVTVTLGRSPINVPEPLASHIRQLLRARPVTTAAKAPGDTGWLFPGHHPGRPVHATTLTKRLRTLGVPVGVARLAALAHIAASMPAAVVADLLGVHPGTAAAWAKATGRTWADYTANRTNGVTP